jgi:tRNA (guanine-N7-)-methyltransferase
VSVRRAKRLPLEVLAPHLLEVPKESGTLCWADVFGNRHPVEIEVGFGKGLFLLTNSQARPDTNFVGIEIDRKYQLFTATRLAKRDIHNVKLACADARRILAEHVPPASVQAIHVYFPDPWWKKRHHKRRLFSAEFAAACQRVLQSGGWLFVVTDVEEYFQRICQKLGEQKELQLERPTGPSSSVITEDQTNFERKCRLAGKPIFRATFAKLQAKNS